MVYLQPLAVSLPLAWNTFYVCGYAFDALFIKANLWIACGEFRRVLEWHHGMQPVRRSSPPVVGFAQGSEIQFRSRSGILERVVCVCVCV